MASDVTCDDDIALFSGWTGIDFSRYRPEDELRYIETEAMRSALASFTSDDPDQPTISVPLEGTADMPSAAAGWELFESH